MGYPLYSQHQKIDPRVLRHLSGNTRCIFRRCHTFGVIHKNGLPFHGFQLGPLIRFIILQILELLNRVWNFVSQNRFVFLPLFCISGKVTALLHVCIPGRSVFRLLLLRPLGIGHVRNNLCFACNGVFGASLPCGGIYPIHIRNKRAAAVVDLPRWPLRIARKAAAVGEFLILIYLFAVQHGV